MSSMRSVDFLNLVWPSQGHYCIASPRKLRDDPSKTYWVHKVFDTIASANAFAKQQGSSTDIYFACLSLKEPFVIDNAKLQKQQERGDKNPTGKTYRTHRNMGWARCFFSDLDVGKQYPDRATAVAALISFLDTTDLPKPAVVSSGKGLHLYWPLTEDVAAEDWKPQAIKLKKLQEYHGFHVDPVRTADTSSVLRVPGTKHLKDPKRPLDVVVVKAGDAPISFDAFVTLLDRAVQLTPTGEAITVPLPESMVDNQPVVLGQLAKACAQIDRIVRGASTMSEPEWWRGLGVIRFVENGRDICHKVSIPHPGYNPDETNKKLDQLERPMSDGRSIGPTTCGTMADTCGSDICNRCWFRKAPGYLDTSSPLVAARRMPKKAVEGIPSPPSPYTRVKDGIMRGSEDPHIICPYDLYPVLNFHDPANNKRSSLWELVVPRKGIVQFQLLHEEVQDPRILGGILGNNGFLPQLEELKWIRHYMSAYIRELQRHQDENNQHSHLGWTDDHAAFILPEHAIMRGKVVPALVTHQVAKATTSIKRAGTQAKQIELLSFYKDERYVRHQFMIACSLASPLFYTTGHYGTVVNMAGESGASKSTALLTAGSLWGMPDDFVINGTAGGGTVKGKNNRFAILSNLPVCVDEITNMNVDDARELVMGFTQKQAEPIKLDRNSVEKARSTNGKSTLLLCTANNSLHEMLSQRNQAGTAGSMRVFEMPTPRIFHTIPEHEAKAEADDFLRALRQNYGHVGPAFMEHVQGNLAGFETMVIDEVKRLEAIGHFRSAERFWSAVAASGMVALKQAYKIGLLPFDPDLVEEWLMSSQLSLMRGIVTSSYANPVDQIMAYLATHANNMLVTDKRAASATPTIIESPRGEYVGTFALHARTITVLQSHLKAYASRERIQLNALLRDLEAAGIATKLKVDPALGSNYSYGRQHCVVFDLAHEAISGHAKANDVGNVISLKAAAQ